MSRSSLKKHWDNYNKLDVPLRAAAMSYHTILSIVPVLGLVFWYLQQIGVTGELAKALQDFILSHLNVGSGQSFLKLYDKLTSGVRGHTWGVVGIVVLVYTAYNLLIKMGDSIDAILRVSEVEWTFSKSFFAIFARRIIVLFGLPIAVIASSILGNLFKKGGILNKLIFGSEHIFPLLTKPLPWIIDAVAFFILYQFVPKIRIPWREALRAALFITPVFELARWAFTFYTAKTIASYKIYGTFAAVPIFFIWVNIAWIIILSGTLFIRRSKIGRKETD
jgi:membrane protein